MVITACPSIQAEYKSLTSIRFFRKLCIALFGDKCLGPEYLTEICDGNIYWTHYYKCCNLENTSFSDLPDRCANEFLRDEIKTLNPKEIIVFGDEVKERICNIISEVTDITPICKSFPSTGCEPEYDEVRSVVKKYVEFMKNDNEHISGKYEYKKDDSQGANVHMNFEFAALQQLIENSEQGFDNSIEAAWNKKILLPNMRMYQNVLTTCSFIENQVKVFLMDYVTKTGNYTFLSVVNKMCVSKKPTLKIALDVVSEGKYMMKNLFDYLLFTESASMPVFYNKLQSLRRIRNCIVHDGGFTRNQSFHDDIDKLTGFSLIGNTIYIDETANGELINIAKDLISILK